MVTSWGSIMISNFFSPDSFDNDAYGHLTNQIGHVSLSLFIIYWLPFLTIPLALFWVAWECRHFYKTNDFKDLTEDLFFELSGIAIYFFPWWVFLAAGMLGFTTYKRVKNAK